MPAIRALAVAPIKGLRVSSAGELELTPSGPRGDRRFVIVDEHGAVVRTDRTPSLVQLGSSWAGDTLELRLPGGDVVSAVPVPGAVVTTTLNGGRKVHGRLVDGPVAEAIGDHLGRTVRLVALDPDQTGADDHAVTLMSEASRAAVGAALGDADLDERRFRMTITVDGVAEWEEHGWAGGLVEAGEALLRVLAPVPRCVITTRDPDDGRRDAPVLKALARLRGNSDVTFGVWCDVERPGVVRVGDDVIYKS